jgi:lysophospholipase L1-like esterase
MASSVPDPFVQKLTAFLSKEVRISFRFSTILFFGFILVTATYAGWEYYWYKAIGLYFIKWHTHIAATALVFSVIPLSLLLVHYITKKAVTAKLLTVGIATWVGFILVEALLLFTGTTRTYSETRYGYYRSPFLYDSIDVYHIVHNQDTVKEFSPEFNHVFPVNSLGFPDREWTETKDSAVYRIVTLGDSFTQGVGAPYDSSYPAQLSKILAVQGIKAEVLNAGVSGSDPVYNYKNMQDRLLPYKPDLVIQAVSENDVLNDFSIMGGFERYTSDSCMRAPNITRTETLYALSHTMRLIMDKMGYNYRVPASLKSVIPVAKRGEILETVINKYNSIAEANGFKVLVVFFPTRPESQKRQYEFDFGAYEKLNSEGNHLRVINLMPCYKAAFKNAADYKTYFWEKDGHHNAKGYALMATCIYNGIAENGLLPKARQ